MKPNFDVIIVGSGPAGVSAAFPLVDSGLNVLMVDGGQQANLSPPDHPFLKARANDDDQWRWMIGENYHALQRRDAVSPKLRAPTHEYVFDNFSRANRIDARDFIAVGSLATGGLSNAWGCGVARLSEDEFAEFPFKSSEISQSYESVARRIGISGGQNDDLSDYYGLDALSQPPINLDALHSYLYERYIDNRGRFSSIRFRLGRSRVAVLSNDRAERKACDLSGNCLWGCKHRSLYSAADELSILRQYKNFSHISGFIVDGISREGDSWLVNGQNRSNRKYESISARKLLLAAGTLATTRLVLLALKLTKPVPLLTCPTAAFLLWLPRLLGIERFPAFGLGQLSFTFTMENGFSAFGSTFGTTGIPVTEFVRHVPISRRYAVDLLRGLLSSCLVGNLFLPGKLSTSEVILKSDGSLLVIGDFDARVPSIMNEAAVVLRKAYRRLATIMLPGSFSFGKPGGDIHYAGTLPMREEPSLGETSADGEVIGLENVYVVDGACLTSLSEKSHTLTIMANADRISRQLIRRFDSLKGE